MSRQSIFHVMTELARIGRNCVMTEDFQVAIELTLVEACCHPQQSWPQQRCVITHDKAGPARRALGECNSVAPCCVTTEEALHTQ